MLYTGGTTGMPKGVMYEIGEITGFFARLGFPVDRPGTVPTTADEIAPAVAELAAAGGTSVSVTGAPLMHGTGLWLGALMHHLGGGHVVTLTSRSLDADELLTRDPAPSLHAQHDRRRRLLEADHPRHRRRRSSAAEPYDTSSLQMIVSSGVMWTTEVKQALLDRMPQVVLHDAMGSTEGSIGNQVTCAGVATETAKFTPNPTTKVFDELDREVAPGSGEIGRVAGGGARADRLLQGSGEVGHARSA